MKIVLRKRTRNAEKVSITLSGHEKNLYDKFDELQTALACLLFVMHGNHGIDISINEIEENKKIVGGVLYAMAANQEHAVTLQAVLTEKISLLTRRISVLERAEKSAEDINIFLQQVRARFNAISEVNEKVKFYPAVVMAQIKANMEMVFERANALYENKGLMCDFEKTNAMAMQCREFTAKLDGVDANLLVGMDNDKILNTTSVIENFFDLRSMYGETAKIMICKLLQPLAEMIHELQIIDSTLPVDCKTNFNQTKIYSNMLAAINMELYDIDLLCENDVRNLKARLKVMSAYLSSMLQEIKQSIMQQQEKSIHLGSPILYRTKRNNAWAEKQANDAVIGNRMMGRLYGRLRF